MKKSITTVLGCLVCGLFVSFVQADMISGPFTTSTPIPSTKTDWTGSLSFPKFNSALGTLTGVQLDLSGGLTTQLTVTNSASSASSGSVRTELQVTVQDAGNNLLVPQLDLFSSGFGYSLAPNTSVTSTVLTKTGLSSDLYTLAAVLAEFNGPGTISLPASTFTQTLLANTGGNTAASQITNAYLTGSVSYSYIPVPEPASLTLLGSTFFGLLVYAWRRRRG